MEHYGERLRQIREDRGYSQRAVAAALDTAQSNISHWEGLDIPPTDAILMLLQFYKESPGEFFEGPGWQSLAPDERDLVKAWRRLSGNDRRILLELAGSLARKR